MDQTIADPFADKINVVGRLSGTRNVKELASFVTYGLSGQDIQLCSHACLQLEQMVRGSRTSFMVSDQSICYY